MAASTQPTSASPSRQEVWRMFDRIAPRYDLLNRLLSMRRDVAWRKHIAVCFTGRGPMDLLDVATGTGDQILHLLAGGADVRRAVGVDMADDMLAVGRGKIDARGLADRVELLHGDATDLPFDACSFDAATISFGIRNVEDVSQGLAEMYRVLRPGGRAVVLEFSLPGNRIMRACYLSYFRHVLPFFGGLVSGDRQAYRYLNRTVEQFPYGEAFCALMRDVGFVNVTAHPLTFGIASVYHGDRAESVT